MKIKEMREKRGQVVKEMNDFNDKIDAENREFSPEEKEKWETFNADVDKWAEKIERQERLDTLNAKNVLSDEQNSKVQGVKKNRNTHLRCFLKSKLGIPLDEEERGLLYSSKGADQFVEFNLQKRAPRNKEEIEQRDMSVGSNADGGYLVPITFVAQLELAKLTFGNVRGVADVMRTATGNKMQWPYSNDTGNVGALIAEGGSMASGTSPQFALMDMNSWKYSSKTIKITFELLRDSEIDLERVLGEMIGERLARIINTHLTTGSGSSQPNGVVTASTLGETAAGAAAITMDETLNLYHSLGSAYRDNARFMFADTTLLLLRKLKDSEGNYIWQMSTRDGEPDRLWGKPTVINDDMPAATTGLKSMLFGDFKKYKVREVGSVRLKWLKELFAETDEEGVLGIESVDGELMDAGTNPMRHLIQA